MHRLALLTLVMSAHAYASHPLITENTNVLGQGVWELELHGECARDDQAGVRTRRSDLAGAYQAGKLEFLAHLAYTDNRNRIGERRSLWHASAAVLYSLTEKLRLLADYGRDSHPDPAAGSHGREFVVGATYALSERIDLGIGLKKGLNDAADDRALRAGVKLRW